jgi:adenylate cyclase
MATTEQPQSAAIMAAGVEGYSSLASGDDQLTRELLAEYLTTLRDVFLRHNGRDVAATGTGLLVLFDSGREALRCAIAIQDRLRRRNALVANERRLEVRVGLEATAVADPATALRTREAGVAKRLASVAPVGGICVSTAFARLLGEQTEAPLEPVGMPALDDGTPGPAAFRVILPWAPGGSPVRIRIRRSWVVIAVALCLLTALFGVWVGFRSAARFALGP